MSGFELKKLKKLDKGFIPIGTLPPKNIMEVFKEAQRR